MVGPSQAQAAITKIERLLDRMPDDLERLRQRINGETWLPPEMKLTNQLLWDKLMILTRQMQQEMRESLTNAETPFIFYRYGEKWTEINERIMKSGHGVAATLRDTVDDSGGFWGGDAGGRYKDAVGRQPDAAQELGDRAAAMAEVCDHLAMAGFVFWVSLALALAGAVGAIIEACRGDLVGGVVGVIIGIMGISAAVGTLTLDVELEQRTLRMAMGGGDTFSRGWPKTGRKP